MKKSDTILVLLAANGGRVSGRTRLQKLAFLAQSEHPAGWPSFRYRAWDYGPYSKELQQTMDDLVDADFVVDTPVTFDDGRTLFEYQLSSQGRARIKVLRAEPEVEILMAVLTQLAKTWGKASLDSLIQHVYASDPKYTVRSKLL